MFSVCVAIHVSFKPKEKCCYLHPVIYIQLQWTFRNVQREYLCCLAAMSKAMSQPALMSVFCRNLSNLKS